jgi:hypothetical protein
LNLVTIYLFFFHWVEVVPMMVCSAWIAPLELNCDILLYIDSNKSALFIEGLWWLLIYSSTLTFLCCWPVHISCFLLQLFEVQLDNSEVLLRYSSALVQGATNVLWYEYWKYTWIISGWLAIIKLITDNVWSCNAVFPISIECWVPLVNNADGKIFEV